MSEVRWLHISDLHFNDDDMSTTMLRDELPVFLRRKDIRCDYVFCTGDIRIWNKDFTDEAAEYLKNLCAAVGCKVSRLFIVPGNHDVDRSAAGRDEAVSRMMFQRKGYYDPARGMIEEDDLRAIHAGQEAFRAFLSKIFDEDRMRCYENPLEPHFSVETPDFNILHVDSTLSYRGGQEANDLVIGTKALQKALKSVNPEKPTIFLTHYSFTSLLQDEKKYVSEILYRSGVRLWLAGHEHDHNLQPLKYLYSVQAGELCYEDKAHAAVLLGNYDTDTLHGYILAYTWYPEGWAEYPIIWHDHAEENQFPFELRIPGDHGRSQENVLIVHANQTYASRMPEKIWDSIFPDLELGGKPYPSGILSLIHELWNTDTPHLILLADGGMGKSTMLLQACQNTERALYIPAESLQTLGYSIEEYCTVSLFEGKAQRLQDFTRHKRSEPDLILMVDGLNEVGGEAERGFITEIKRLNILKGIQIVISSRTDFTPRYSMPGYQAARLLPLRDDQINAFFDDCEWSAIEARPTLRHLLSNPMMLTMYRKVSPVMERCKDIEFLRWRTPIKNAADLLFDYYTAQIAVLLEREGITGDMVLKAVRSVYDILPFIAYSYESTYKFYVQNKEFREMIKAAAEKPAFDGELQEIIAEYFRCEIPDVTYLEAVDILTNGLHLLHKGNEFTAFPHQIHRDYLSAYWIFRESDRTEDTASLNEMWNSRGISRPVMTYIRQLSVNYWPGIAEKLHNTGKYREDASNLNGNLLDCFPYTGKSGIPDYSGLDLSGLQLPDFPLQNHEISLKGTSLDEVSIGKLDRKPLQFQHLVFSEDNGYLAGNEGNQILIFPLRTSEEVFRHHASAAPGRLEFAGDYLFAVIGSEKIIVFKRLDVWTYMCEIRAIDHGMIFNKRLRRIVLKDDVICFYFNNCECQYQLSDGKKIKNVQKKHAYETSVAGYDLTQLRARQTKSGNKALGEICRAEHNGLTAKAMEDGSLTVSGGDETYHVLNRGITLLKDGAISGDGKWAATLSYEVFRNKRKIQFWDLDHKKKIKELYCPQEICRLYLSQYGSWIIGETDKKSWVFSVEDGIAQWYEEHFISNQRSKLITYGDCVFRKNEDKLVYLYNLKTKEASSIENLSNDAHLAVFMPDGSLASVGKNAVAAFFKNTRSGATARVNRQPAKVIGIYPLKKQPFIAIATQNKTIGIYHTGTEQPLKYIDTSAGTDMVSVHPEEGVIACSNGRRFETHNFYEKQYDDRKRGWWYRNPYAGRHHIHGTVLDLDFNSANHELVVILSNGEIIFCHEKYCGYHGKLDIITNFNVAAYDFRGCVCSEEIREQLRQNGALID